MNAMLTGGLLAASLCLGQATEPNHLQLTQGQIIVQDVTPTPLGQPQTKPMTPAPQRPFIGWFQREERPILSKMQNWFKKDPEKEGQPLFQPFRPGGMRETPPPPLIAPPGNDFPRKLPSSGGQLKPLPVSNPNPAPPRVMAPNTVVDPSAQRMPRTPILPQFADKIARDDNFTWITGQLEIENNNYVIYYATPDIVDRFHGRVYMFAPQNELSKFRRGDLVSVTGQLTQRQTAQGVVPVYRIDQAHLIERPR